MFKVPQRVLQKLLCVHCGGYLSTMPIMIHPNGEQICGKCFKILPDDKKSDCIRQTGLEAVAEVLIFPCRYNLQGCNYVFLWDNEKDHESKCSYRYNTLPLEELLILNKNDDKSNGETGSEYTWESDEIKLKVKCENVDNFHFESDDKLKLNVDITGNNGHKLVFVNSPNNTGKSHATLSIESLLTLKESPEVTYCYVSLGEQDKTDSVPQENQYESINYTINTRCNKCRKLIINDEIYHCLFGHNCCKTCKGLPCLICGKQVTGESYFHCNNLDRGCINLFKSSEIEKHKIDCPFNDFTCPLLDCQFLNTMTSVTQHFVTEHQVRVFFGNESTIALSRRDNDYFFYCYNFLFNCKYYFYDDFVEFVMKYVGSNDDAANYKYQVSVSCDYFNIKTSHKANCLGWNEVSLQKAVSFQIKDQFYYSPLKYEAVISILK